MYRDPRVAVVGPGHHEKRLSAAVVTTGPRSLVSALAVDAEKGKW